ncbi:hypothetical protein ACJQWK_04773 [Exserohilum turcicum]|uniref:Peptide hydrolase n=1 Tax=Exserohilum turcicum (strain 28A) TaxID=671987 RepID=R0JMS3_EXST2|nr:uncharacterized protein SETTUDRAFT_140664 [Exserohilum turcica Et28A]EOA82523.1 hypothetical protein SETTUDRAFT_140664 [Exserohilum turcica Et28A]
MRTAIFAALAAAVTANPTLRSRQSGKELVTPDALKAEIKVENLMAGAQTLQTFADSQSNGTRVLGSAACNSTLRWVKDELDATGAYDVELQQVRVVRQVSGQINSSMVNGTNVTASLLEYSPSGSVTATLVPVANLGCEASDYPSAVAGKIALISRGTCAFGQKSALAGAAGAAAAILYNNVNGTLGGTLSPGPRPEGAYIPTIGIAQELGVGYVAAIKSGASISATINVKTEIQNMTTYNVLATTKTGERTNKLCLGAHTDSVAEGPGLNDDGSGTIGILEVAKALAKYQVHNAVVFGFWAAEEAGLVGSKHFVSSLSAEDLAKIRAYLNFDMIASPNYINGIYSSANAPTGSAALESVLNASYASAGANTKPITYLTGLSDHASFQDAGIPVSGIFTGGSELKTEEEARLFGGQMGVSHDRCNHKACDTAGNLSADAFLLSARGVAHAVATFAVSWEGVPERRRVMN